MLLKGSPGGAVVKNPPANAGVRGSAPGWGRIPGGGKGNPLQYSCLGNPTDREAWQAIVLGTAELDMTEKAYVHRVNLDDFNYNLIICEV